MIQRSIDWLQQQELNKKFTVCKDSDRQFVNDPDFEDWITKDSWKHVSTWGGDGFTTSELGFSFCGQAAPLPKDPKNPFPFVYPVYTRYGCNWENVTAIYQGNSGWVYIFTKAKKKARTKKAKRS